MNNSGFALSPLQETIQKITVPLTHIQRHEFLQRT
jgi:hypothetical protein